MTALAVSVLCAFAVWLAVRAGQRSDPAALSRLAGLAEASPSAVRVRPRRRFTGEKMLARLGGKRRAAHPRIKMALAEAGMDGVEPGVVAGWQICMSGLGVVFGLRAGTAALLAAPLLGFAGYRLPALYLSSRARARRDEVAASLPDAVDLMAVCTQAGLNPSLSLARVAAKTPGALGKELSRAVEEIDLGVPRGEALKSLAARNQIDEVAALVAVLSQSDRFGTGIASSLQTFAEEVRRSRRRRAEEQARRAPVKILFPMVFLILPAFLVLTILPVVLGTLRNIGF